EFAAQAIFLVLAVLAHHDYGSLDCGEHGKKQVEQNKWIRIPGFVAAQETESGITKQENQKSDDEGPGAAKTGDCVRDVFSERSFFFDDFIGIASCAKANELL